ncbi:carbonic anhydrase [Paraburkholderia phymatum]|uniref:Carbonic anhydrase n=1 Tax=Paraburkholderia phymatum (strain DSM 17167 / CIP 108236 / LMG 21445 / STM815) TaxID=391038 RepID=B2JN69_PARP8|nr:carbonic anhydrase [Paraburkholderia phymatum]ACC72917.1 carbonic anhydrase [Paraburkholderia phymatum STM815]
MCTCYEYPRQYNASCRRRFLRWAGTAALASLAPVALVPAAAHADALTKAQRDSMTPQQIIDDMKQGNARFQRGERKPRNYLREQRASASGQYPAAVLLSCIDSRAPAEVIMDLGIGDIFNCRVAGNVENGDMLGSMEFACKLSGAKVVVVMGHTSCGAIKGAIANAELGNLTGLLDKIKPAVQATEYNGERSAANYAFVNAVARKNVELTIANIRRDSPVLAEMEKQGAISIVGAMYDLHTGALEFLG